MTAVRVLLAVLAVLPLLPAVLLLATRERSWRMGFVMAAAAWGTAVVVITEGLTLARALTPITLAVAWAVLSAAAFSLHARARRAADPRGAPGALGAGDAAAAARDGLRALATGERALLATTLLWLAAVFLVAALAAPNNWDSMTYHMSRVAHWAHQGSVSHYPTHITRQIFTPPWAAFAILHFQVLSGGDRFANLVQFCALVGCVVNVSAIAGRLGATPRGQALAAVACATLPVAILEGTSTQNDLVAAFWLSCFVAVLCDRRAASGAGAGMDQRATLALGASLGLALLTKGTSYLLCLGFAALTVPLALRSGGKRGVASLALAAALAALLNLGHVGRNLITFGRPLSTGEGLPVIMETLTPAIALSNLLRNAAVHFDSPAPSWTQGVQETVEVAHRMLGVDTSDPRITRGPAYPVVKGLRIHEDLAGNPLHLLLALAAGGALAFCGPPQVRAYAAALVLSSAALCLGLKWQIWISRLQLPLFVLVCPLLGVAADRLRARVGRVLALILLAAALPYVVANETRALIGSRSILYLPRSEQYFANQPPLFAPYQRAARSVAAAGCTEAGLILDGDDLEYPLWALLAEEARRKVELRHLRVPNVSATPFRPDTSCALVVVSLDRIPGLTRSLGRPPEWVDPPVSFWPGPIDVPALPPFQMP